MKNILINYVVFCMFTHLIYFDDVVTYKQRLTLFVVCLNNLNQYIATKNKYRAKATLMTDLMQPF